ncbi:MAG: response regulator [Myxococcota bacterium]|nr:response regulator [Myxococcota bacterium]
MTVRLVHVVDDDPRVRETLVWMLKAIGFDAVAHEGPDSVPVETGDCVILDEHLGDRHSGLDSVDPNTGYLAEHPVVLLTGFAHQPETQRRAAAAGVRHVLGKPTQIQHLMAAVEAAMAEAI